MFIHFSPKGKISHLDLESDDLKKIIVRRGGWFNTTIYENRLIIDLSRLIKGLRLTIVFNHELLEKGKVINSKAHIRAKYNGLTMRFKNKLLIKILEDIVKK